MSYFISRVPPVFKQWQFQNVSEGISREDWLDVVNKFEAIYPLEDVERFNLISIQNPEFHIHFWQTKRYGEAIYCSSFPERYKGEFVKHLYQICQHLNANLYSLSNDGHTADKFDFSAYQEQIDKEYFPLNEKKVTNIEISEMMGLMCIPNTTVESVASFLKLHKAEITTWEDAVSKCYNSNKFMIRSLKGWIIVIGQFDPLVNKVHNKPIDEDSDKEEFIDFLKIASSRFKKVSYTFNASKYSYFENYIAEDGRLVYKYIHGDGDEELEGESSNGYFNDFLAFCYDETILEGVQLYD